MKRQILLLLSLLVLLTSSACQKDRRVIPELLDPVGVQMDLAQAKTDTIQSFRVYEGSIVPHVEQLQFETNGILKEVAVSLGEQVTKGQVLAVLSEDDLLRQIEDLEAELEQTKILGEFSDRMAEADIAIAKVEREKLLAWGTWEKPLALKELEIQKLEKALQQERELRALQVAQLQKKLDSLREQMGKNTLTAPCDGKIAYLDLPANGAAVQGYQTVICVTDETKLYLQTDFIPSAAINSFSRICCRIEDREYELTYLPYDVQEYLQQSFLGEKVKTRFLVQAPEGKLKIGQYAVVLATDRYKENVLTIPANALHSDSAGDYVYKVVDGSQIRCDVTVGIVTDLKAEITAGLQEGDLVHVKE